jgi:lipopolysaccharide export system permease protein
LAAVTFTLMGASFGISINRRHSIKGIVYVIALAAFFLVAYYVAKAVDHSLMISPVFYLIPHLVMIGLSMRMLNRISQGIET